MLRNSSDLAVLNVCAFDNFTSTAELYAQDLQVTETSLSVTQNFLLKFSFIIANHKSFLLIVLRLLTLVAVCLV